VTPKVELTLWLWSSMSTGSGQLSAPSQFEGGHPSRVEEAHMLMV
jgi:hypothetical protein